MTQPAKSQEPSMEEILASIRRIIADDDATQNGQPPDAPVAAAAAPRRAAPARRRQHRRPMPAPSVPRNSMPNRLPMSRPARTSRGQPPTFSI